MVKLAPALSKKVLYPSNLERQNVLLAVKLFDEKNIAALKLQSRECNGTAEFLEIILSWWKVVNVRSPKSGHHLRDPFRNPITNTEHESVKFLSRFLEFKVLLTALVLL